MPKLKSKLKKSSQPSEEDNINDILSDISQQANNVVEQEKEEEKQLPKRKGRKPKNKMFDLEEVNIKSPNPTVDNKVSSNTDTNTNTDTKKVSLNDETEDYILLQLPIHSKDLEKVEFTGDKLMTYSDKIEPEPTHFAEESHFQNVYNLNNQSINNYPPSIPSNTTGYNVVKIINEKPQPVEYTKHELQKRFENIKERKPGQNYESKTSKQVKLMTQFNEAGKYREWPQTTKIYCFWCCHPFDSIPWGVPVKYVNEVYHVDGNFCSPECAAAYNFDQKDSSMWERYMLLNMMYNKVNQPIYQKLKLAPPRRLLSQFGGTMSIFDFREYCQNYSKDYIINYPPMINIPTMAEEFNLPDHFRQKVVYMDPKRVDEASRRCLEKEDEIKQQGESLYKCFTRITGT